jgi:hypothetical protein
MPRGLTVIWDYGPRPIKPVAPAEPPLIAGYEDECLRLLDQTRQRLLDQARCIEPLGPTPAQLLAEAARDAYGAAQGAYRAAKAEFDAFGDEPKRVVMDEAVAREAMARDPGRYARLRHPGEPPADGALTWAEAQERIKVRRRHAG